MSMSMSRWHLLSCFLGRKKTKHSRSMAPSSLGLSLPQEVEAADAKNDAWLMSRRGSGVPGEPLAATWEIHPLFDKYAPRNDNWAREGTLQFDKQSGTHTHTHFFRS